MSSQNERDLSRVAATSLDHIARSARSCHEAAAHVRSSREAIDRSLELLSSTLVHNNVPDANLDEGAARVSALDVAA